MISKIRNLPNTPFHALILFDGRSLGDQRDRGKTALADGRQTASGPSRQDTDPDRVRPGDSGSAQRRNY